jgi:hypothetical protein
MVPAPRIRVTDGELPKGPGGGIRAVLDVQVVGPPSNLISCTGARLMEPSRAESGETARQIPGTAPALRRATRSQRTAPAGGAPLPGSWRLENRRACLLNITGRAPGRRRYPIRKVTTPVPVEGGVAGGALAMSAGTSFHGRRKLLDPAMVRRWQADPSGRCKTCMRSGRSCETSRASCC